MPLVNLKQVMDFAQQKKCGIGMFNVVNLEFATAIVDAAEDANLPVILGMPERFFQFYSLQSMSEICISLANRAKVPVVVHLDHGRSFDIVMKALRAGFTSVMYDGSNLDYEENLKNIAEIVKVAHTMGVSVEGELGYVGRGIDTINPEHYTKPEQAYDFVSRSQVDALAIAVGNLHGTYKGTPQLDFQRIADIRGQVDCGLVLHGGSGLSDADFVKAIKCGINKVNIYTIMSETVMDYISNNLNKYSAWLDLSKDLRLALQDLVKQMIMLFGCDENSDGFVY
jgi:fructose-bisphosphate aldolase class II